MNVQLPDPAHSRIVLIGTPAHVHADERLPDVPVVANNVTDLAAVFTDPELGGFDARHCATAAPNAGMPEIGELLTSAAEQAKDLLLIYYAGHGLLDRRGKLHLALAGTHPDRLGFTALPYETLQDVCLDSAAKSRVVILDSCYSGRAIGKPLADAGQEILEQLEARGTYTLTSAPANRTALILPGERHTAFTGRLLDLLRNGGPELGDVLSMGEIYRHLHARLTADGLPTPQQRGTETADLLGLVRNRRPAPPPVAKLPEGIQDGLDSGRPKIRLAAVEEIGEWLTHTDQAKVRAAVITLRYVAEHDNPTVASAARALLAALATATSEPAVVSGTATISSRPEDTPLESSATPDPDWAAMARRVAGQAEDIAKEISSTSTQIPVLGEIARAWATIHFTKASEVAAEADGKIRYIASDVVKLNLLAYLAHAWAALDRRRARHVVDRAAAIAEKIGPHARNNGWSRAEVARAWAAVDPLEAERIATHLPAGTSRAGALVEVTRALAVVTPALPVVDLRRARLMAVEAEQSIDGLEIAPELLAECLAAIATGWAVVDRAEARRVAEKVESIANDIGDMDPRMQALAAAARAWAAVDPTKAAHVAALVMGIVPRAQAFAAVARGWATADPEKAEKIANSITVTSYKAQALAQIARAWGENARSADLTQPA